MVEKWIKIARKENNKDVIFETIEKILTHKTQWLDITSIRGKKWYFRCRIWNIRIIFFEKWWEYFIETVWYRWDVYKKY